MSNICLGYQASQSVPLLIREEKAIPKKYYWVSTWWETKRTGIKPLLPFFPWQSRYSPTRWNLSVSIPPGDKRNAYTLKDSQALLGVLEKKQKKKKVLCPLFNEELQATNSNGRKHFPEGLGLIQKLWRDTGLRTRLSP